MTDPARVHNGARAYLCGEASQDEPETHEKRSSKGDKLDSVHSCNKGIHKDASTPCQSGSNRANQRYECILSLCTLDIGFRGGVKLLDGECLHLVREYPEVPIDSNHLENPKDLVYSNDMEYHHKCCEK